MNVLSLLQPWASLVGIGVKTVETRSWQTACRGELLIHASLGKSGGLIAQRPPFSKYIQEFSCLPFGAIFGKVILADIIPVDALYFSNEMINKLALEERAFGDYTKGRYAWMLEEPIAFEEIIRVKGSLMLWNYDL